MSRTVLVPMGAIMNSPEGSVVAGILADEREANRREMTNRAPDPGNPPIEVPGHVEIVDRDYVTDKASGLPIA